MYYWISNLIEIIGIPIGAISAIVARGVVVSGKIHFSFWLNLLYTRGVFRTQSNIYEGFFSENS